MDNHTAKHFVLQLGSLISLYVSVAYALVLLFGLINLRFPDATEGYWAIESASSNVRLGIAVLIVSVPTYLFLTRFVNRLRRTEKQSAYLSLTKWLIYFSLLLGAIVLLGDLIVVIMAFLEGELTQRFIYKAGAVLLVVGGAFHYYLLDARGYWLKKESQSIMYGIGVGILALVLVGAGFSHIEAPSEVREQKLDATQIMNLQEIQWRIQDHIAVNGTVPDTVEELYTANPVPTAPENRPDYRYEKTTEGFALCATFSTTSEPNEFGFAQPMKPTEGMLTIVNPDNWEHGTGEMCFQRIVK